MTMTIKLIEDKYGRLSTRLLDSTPEYHEEMLSWQAEVYDDPLALIPIIGYYQDCEWPEPRQFKMTDEDIRDDDNVSLQAALFGLFETGQVDDKVLGRTFELPDGTTIEV